jgi:glycosyltransferase involved in cell wall biosynthesis
MSISIAIATYNRAEEVRRTLATLALLEPSDGIDYEILVVANNCTDDTADVVRGMAARFGGSLRYIEESEQGLSHARNRAIAEAKYEIVAFLDDDVDVHPRWLRQLSAAHASGEHGAIGGRAYLVYPQTRPRWLGERDEGLLTKVELGPCQREVAPDELFGVNLSVTKQWAQKVGLFRADLGRMGRCLLGGEETDLLERIQLAGGKLLYEPNASVGHRVPIERLRRRWFWARAFWGKVGEVRCAPHDYVSPRGLLSATYRALTAAARAFAAFVYAGPWSEECFHQTKLLASRLGRWVGIAEQLHPRWHRPSVAVQPTRIVTAAS